MVSQHYLVSQGLSRWSLVGPLLHSGSCHWAGLQLVVQEWSHLARAQLALTQLE